MLRSKQFIEVALKCYLKALEQQARNVEIMKSKEFDYGTPVIDLRNDEIYIIIGHYDIDGIVDKERDMYRVHVSERMPYMGINRKHIQLYHGEIPENLKDVKWNEIHQVVVPLIETKDELKTES